MREKSPKSTAVPPGSVLKCSGSRHTIGAKNHFSWSKLLANANNWTDIEAQVDRAIERAGWFATGVFPEVVSGTPAFTYSAGFGETLGIPDVVIVGFDPQLAHGLLSAIYEQVKAGHVAIPEAGGKIHEIIQDYPVRFDPVPDDLLKGFATVTLLRDGAMGRQTRFMHMLLPDRNGKFAGEPGADDDYAARQALYGILTGPDETPRLH